MANGLFNLKQVMQGIQQGGWSGQKPPQVEYLVVAGGGGGGRYNGGGGGGAGGLLAGIDPVPNGQTLLVTVGSGGAGGTNVSGTGQGISGSNSVFGSISAIGGGGGGGADVSSAPTYNYGASGGSGGGSGTNGSGFVAAGQGTFGQGNAGGRGNSDATSWRHGGGGGGAGAIGLDVISGTSGGLGNGGSGIASAINGTVTTYAGGGGGGAYVGVKGVGGVGGGGNGGESGSGTSPTAGTANTGGGGGGGGGGTVGAAGGSGIVIVSYPDVYAAPTATTGSPTVSTSGSGSISLNGSSQYLNYGNQTALHLSSGNFTVEMWIYKNANTAYMTACGDTLTSPTNTFEILGDATGSKIGWYDGASGVFKVTSAASISTGTWTHIAFVRSGSTLTLYINGVSDGVATLTTDYNATTSFYVGQAPELLSGRYWNGYISNFRMVKGTAVYTSNFTPSTTPLTAITNTSLLLNTVSGAPFADGSTNSFSPSNAISISPAWNASSPFTVTGYKNRVYTWTSSGSITF